jgi:MYXO-CTERM domain-containing protein
VQGLCVEPCHGGEFPCPGGYECGSFGGKSYCVPTTCNDVECPPGASCSNGKCTLDGAGGAGNEGGAGTGGDAGEGAVGQGGDSGGQGAESAGGESDGGANTAGTSSGATTGSAARGNDDGRGRFGLVTGGGGCDCRVAPSRGAHAALGLSLALLGALFTRRRRAAARRAA